jgi:cob(I)alamin adenosyltransferase
MTVYTYSGTSGGKTTNSIGIAIRTLAHGKSVLMVQFTKWEKKTGEYIFANKYNNMVEALDLKEPLFYIYQFGREGWHGYDNLNEEDKKLCDDGIKLIKENLTHNALLDNNSPYKLGLLIMDEINIATHFKLVSITDLKAILEVCKQMDINVVLTGRFADAKIVKLSDIVNEIICLKEPDQNHMIYQEGVQY